MTSESRKIDIKSLSYKELVNWFINFGEKKFRADQVFKWVYQHQCDNFDDMSNLNKNLRKILKSNFTIQRLKIKSILLSSDGSKKYAFKLSDNNIVESLLLPEKNHYTLCVSSQIGCAQKCSFCMTSKSGLIRNLASHEIIAQIRDIQNKIKLHKLPLTNIVFMGMGEPLANYEQVIKALKIISNQSCGLKISSRRITISTSGLIPKIKLLPLNTNANLAISLNAADNKTRDTLMPINKTYSIEALLKICRNYPLNKRQKITFEYVLIQKINDSNEDAKKLAILLKKTKSKINLIPFNEHNGCNYKRPSKKRILEFQKILLNKNYTTIIRNSKGNDILGACGQLRAKYEIKI